ncbi:TPR_REGION domain-containing protein, partial [Haematococcus lacustris]
MHPFVHARKPGTDAGGDGNLTRRPEGLCPRDGAASNSTEDLQSCLRLARSLNAGKRPLEALQLIEKNIHRSPGDVELLHLRGLCLEASNNGPAVRLPVGHYQPLIARTKFSPLIAAWASCVYIACMQAFATYMSVLNINPKHAPSLCCVGAMYKARGMLQEAMSAYAKALEVQPGSAAIQHALAALLTDLGTQAKGKGASGEALDYYQRAIEMAPTYAPAFYNLGVLHSECKQFDVALDWYQKAISVQPNYAEAHCNMGVIYKDRGDLEAAIACYESALEASPNFAIVKGNLAIALTDLGTRVKLAGRLAEGCALYERALAHNPKYADALYNLGVAYGEPCPEAQAGRVAVRSVVSVR